MDRGVWRSHMVFVTMGSQRVGYDWATNTLSLHTTLYNTSILSSCFFKHSKKKKKKRYFISAMSWSVFYKGPKTSPTWGWKNSCPVCKMWYVKGIWLLLSLCKAVVRWNAGGSFQNDYLVILKSLNYAKGDIWPILSTMWRGGDFVFKRLSSLIILKVLCLWRGLLPPPPMRGALGHFLWKR